MGRRARAIVLLVLAGAAALAAASMVSGYRSSVADSYGLLRPVVVATDGLAAHSPIGPKVLTNGMTVRRVPARFVPVGALSHPEQAIGMRTAIEIPAGSYLTRESLEVPAARGETAGPRLEGGRRPVEIRITSSVDALAGSGSMPRKVDVVVTTEPRGAGAGRTYVAATAVRLLDLRGAGSEPGLGRVSLALLALSREQALDLIQAESFARQIRILPAGG